MKFKIAVIVSVVLHISIFAIAFYVPMESDPKGTVYYVDLINMPGGGGGGGNKAQKGGGSQVQKPQRMKDLTTQKEETQSKLRYPDENKNSKRKKNSTKKKKPKKKELITMTRKNRSNKDAPVTVSRKGDSNVLKTGISAGGGGGTGGGYGGGTGSGYGPGSGSGIGFFPYAYYIETLRNKVSTSWYSGLVSPGQRGQFLVIVEFKIQRNGRISDLKISQKSGVSSLDLSALRAIENSAPFPPLPGDYPYSYLPISFDFVWGNK
jgi:TonB family protein